jgi:hypothetical protein
MTSADVTHIDWYIGLLLPRALCPHPNFGGMGESPTPRDRFTDLIGFRLLTNQSAHQPPDVPSDEWPALLIEHLGQAVAPSAAGPSPLRTIESDLPIGPRAALAVISAFRLVAERDDYPAALRLLEEARGSFDAAMPSHALPVAGLALQHVARTIDAGYAEGAENDVALARHLLARVETRPEPAFPVSRGIDWSAGDVMSDVVDLLGSVADVLEAQLSKGMGGTWQRLVRSRTPWGAELVQHARRRAGVAFLEDSFEATARPLSESVTMRSSHPVLGPLREALLLCEFAGDIVGSRHARHELAMGLVTDTHEATSATAGHVPEALTLLVSADKDKDVSSIASRALRSGPPNQLREVAERVLRAPLFDARPTKAELALLRQAAPLLDGDQQAKALGAAMEYPSLDPVRPRSSGGQARWARLEPALRSVAAHLPRSGADRLAAAWLLGRLRDAEDTVEYVGGAAYAAVAGINWSAVDQAEVADWLAWLSAGSPAAATGLLCSLGDLIVGPERTRAICGRPKGVELAVRLLTERWEAELVPDPAELDRCETDLTELVSALVRDSAQGRMSIGQWPILDVALALAMEFGLEPLREDVMSALGNPVVPLRLKSEALDRIAAKAAQEPEHAAVTGLQEVAVSCLADQLREQSDPFFGHTIVPSPAALRALAAARALGTHEVVRAYSDLAASPDPIGRVEAARSAPYVLLGVEDDGQQVIRAGLLFLAQDIEPAVRAQAASSLASGEWNRFAEDAVRELLAEPGMAAPLGVLRGFAASADGWADDWQQRLESAVSSLLSHEAATVREAAARLLES